MELQPLANSLLTAVCQHCASGNSDHGCQGPCPCRADPERRDILVHIANASHGRPTCPLHKHDNIDPGEPIPAPEPPKPIPRSEWPIWAKGLALMAVSYDAGIGDTVARLIGDANSERFKTWYKNIFGGECGCAARRAEWNAIYRYQQN